MPTLIESAVTPCPSLVEVGVLDAPDWPLPFEFDLVEHAVSPTKVSAATVSARCFRTVFTSSFGWLGLAGG
jgi:hypothetical protein